MGNIVDLCQESSTAAGWELFLPLPGKFSGVVSVHKGGKCVCVGGGGWGGAGLEGSLWEILSFFARKFQLWQDGVTWVGEPCIFQCCCVCVFGLLTALVCCLYPGVPGRGREQRRHRRGVNVGGPAPLHQHPGHHPCLQEARVQA